MSKDVRDRNFANSGPGPGSYTIPSKVEEGPKYILGLKPEINPQKNRTETGPGQYNPKKLYSKISYSISVKHNRELSHDKLTPGPGHYSDLRDKYYSNIPGSQIGKD